MKCISIDSLRVQYSDSRIPYDKLLQTAEWKERRTSIIDRDYHKCKKCDKGETIYDRDFMGSGYEVIYWTDIDFDEQGNHFTIEIHADKPYHLHVHHTYYVLDKFPREYPDDALLTLCNWCHWDFHQKNVVPVYRNSLKHATLNLTPCNRCSGAGHLPHYNYVQNGICFECGGARYYEFIVKDKKS